MPFMELKPDTRIILALDVIERNKAFRILREVHDLIDGVKINHPLIHSCGIGISGDIKDVFSLPVIGDFKIADVPVTNRKIVNLCIKNKIDFLTVHGFIGYANLSDIKEYGGKRIDFFMITELTSDNEVTLFPYEDFARIALDLGFYGAQAPATKPKVIKIVKDLIGNSMTIISCGIGAQGAKPGSAIEANADFEIIGRAIYLSKKPREITKKYAEMIRKVVE